MSNTNFDDWLSFYVDPDEYDINAALYQAIAGEEVESIYEITRKGSRVFVKLGDGETLALLSEKAVETFLKKFDERFGNGLGVVLWADCQRAADNTP